LKQFSIGDRVVMTREALRLMGILRAVEVARTWSVTECYCALCRSGRFVCTDQLAANEDGWRHIATVHLRLEGEPTVGELVANGVRR
jgi:hypothetical protein